MSEYLYETISSGDEKPIALETLPLFPWIPALLGLRILPAELAGSRLRNLYFCKLSVIWAVRIWMNLWVGVSLEFTNQQFQLWEFLFPHWFIPRRKVEERHPYIISQTEQERDLTVSLSGAFLVVHVTPQAWPFCGVAGPRKRTNILNHIPLQAEQKSLRWGKDEESPFCALRGSSRWLL